MKIYCVSIPVVFGIVASFAEAWIENFSSSVDGETEMVASFAEAWIEKNALGGKDTEAYGRLLRGGVD